MQREGSGNCAFGKQALSHAERDGKYFEPQFINQVVFQKCLDEIATTMHL